MQVIVDFDKLGIVRNMWIMTCVGLYAYLDGVNHDVPDARVRKILASATNGDAVTTVASHVVDIDISRLGLQCNTIIATLVDKIP